MNRHERNDRHDDEGFGPWGYVPPGYVRPGDVIDMPTDGAAPTGRRDHDRGDSGRRTSGPGSRAGRPRPVAAGASGRGSSGGSEIVPVRAAQRARRGVDRVGRSVVRAGARAGAVARHPRTRAVLAWLLRNAIVYPATGAWVLAVRWWEARTNARYEGALRAAEAAGDREGFAEWEQRGEQARERRHRRRMDWLDAPADIVRAIITGVLTVTGLLLGLGIILATSYQDISYVIAPARSVIDAITWCTWLVSVLWGPVVTAAPWVVLVVLWQVGRTRGRVPTWAAPAATIGHQEVIVTPGGIAAALAHLGIPALNKAIKDGWQVEFSTPPVRVNGRGYQAIFSLPMGVTPDMLADKRDVLARNLHRAPLEVWPAAAEIAGQVDLWASDPGSTEKPAPPYPLLNDGTADVFTGIPCGISQRGDVIAPVLPGANVVFGGMMGQGKSNAARILMAGAALDPIAVLWVFVFAYNGDFDAYIPRLARYYRGTDDFTVTNAVESLRELYDEVGRREARLSALGAKKVTRQLAEHHPDLRPVVALFSECHELFGHDRGKEAADLAVQTMRRARKTAITLVFDTQSARADAIPPKIVELVKINACFAVKTWRNNDGFLGDGSFQAGIRATELRQSRDVGTSVVTGATSERFEIVKWYFLDVDDDTGYDAATDLIARAMANLYDLPEIRPEARPVAAESDDEPDGRGRDLLDDVATVIGVHDGRTDKVSAADVAVRLRELAPDWQPYQSINGLQVRAYLEGEFGVTLPTTGRRYPVDPDLIRDLLIRRDAVEGSDR